MRVVLLAAAFALALAPTVAAHSSDPRYQSTVRAIVPGAAGLEARILGTDDQIELVNRTGRTVLVTGYENEPYVRIDANGDVWVNMRSPAHYLNRDRYGEAGVPPSAAVGAKPRWRRLAATGRYAWHDHRIHWMSHTLPAQIEDREQTSKIQDWTVPLRVGARKHEIRGDLYWRPPQSARPSTTVVATGFGVVAVLLAAGLLVARRRTGG